MLQCVCCYQASCTWHLNWFKLNTAQHNDSDRAWLWIYNVDLHATMHIRNSSFSMRVGFQETSQSKILESQICVKNGGSISTAQRNAERAAKMCPIKGFQLALATFNLCNAKMVKVLVTYLIWHAFGCKVWQKVHLGSQVLSSVLQLLWPQ